MKKQIIIVLFLLSLSDCKREANEKVAPTAVKGILDLRGSTTLTKHGSTEFIPSGAEVLTNHEGWDFEKDGTVDLVGEWEFYWNELIENPEEQKAFFKNYDPSKIQYIPVPSEWQNIEVNGRKLPVDGYAMYRLKVLFKKGEAPISFYLTDYSFAYKLYINRILSYSVGKVGKSIEEMEPLLKYGTLNLREETPEELEIIVLISNFHHARAGMWNKITIGHFNQIDSYNKVSIARKSLTFGCLFIMGVYHLFLFSFRRKDKTPLFFGIFCIILSLRIILMEDRVILDAFPFIPFLIISKIEYLTFYTGLPFFLLFMYHLFQNEFSKYFLYPVLFCCFIAALCTIFLPLKYYSLHVFQLMEIIVLLSVLYTSYVFALAAIRKRPGAILVILGTSIFYIAVVNDLMYGVGIIRTTHLIPYGFLAFIFSQSAILSIRFSNAFTMSENLTVELKEKSNSLQISNTELTELKEGLEIKVEERTKKLEDAYQKNLQEEQKVSKLKAEIFTIQERENLFFDIHDHIKGDVSELGLLLEKIKTFEVPTDISNQASHLLKRVATSVKNRMLMLEDKQLLEENFTKGLQMSLLRRYTALNRRFIFEMGELAEDKLSNASNEFRNNFYSITTEISNNDLKYGFGDSFWKIDLVEKDKILLEMKSNSNYNGSLDTGKGHIGISRKVESLGGTLLEEITNGIYTIRILAGIHREVL